MKFSKLETIVIIFLAVILIISIVTAPKGSYLKGDASNTVNEEVTKPTEEIPSVNQENIPESNRPEKEAPLVENDFNFEQMSFVATVIEETSEYMIVEPAEDEEEYRISKRISIVYPTSHIDYLYGIGRRVIINYTYLMAEQSPDFRIKTDNILTDGYENFEISAKEAESKSKILIYTAEDIDAFDSFADSIDENLYYYGISQVQITVNGETMELAAALAKGYVTLDGIIRKCNSDVSAGICEEISYDDGGSSMYKYGSFNIIKYHTFDGNRDVYIGSPDMDINICDMEVSLPQISSHPNIPYEDKWGLTLNIENVLPTGLTYSFSQSGGNPSGELNYGSDYVIEKLADGEWSAVEYIVNENVAWTSEAYIIPKDGETPKSMLNWEYLYGELVPGTYRICKSVLDFRQTGDFDKETYYAEFQIN